MAYHDIKNKLKLAIAQLNPTVGDVIGNLKQAHHAHQEASADGADIILFTELFMSGYPAQDLILKPSFIRACESAIQELALLTKNGAAIIIGTPLCRNNKIVNGVVVIDQGEIIGECLKSDLPNYGVFDEKRVFYPAQQNNPIIIRGLSVGIPICEDIWNNNDVIVDFVKKGAQFILVPNASPYETGKIEQRFILVKKQQKIPVPVIYANQFGGQDELVFDGGSFGLQSDGAVAFQLKHFDCHLAITQWTKDKDLWRCTDQPFESYLKGEGADYQACLVGLRDYVTKNGFKGVLLGLSGGIDSALCAAMAVDALGADKVHAVMLPYHYTSQESLKDAQECARLLGCRYDIIPISEPVEGFLNALTDIFQGTQQNVTEENLQSRTRGSLLMALSNKFGSLLLTTGNKSEMAVGYSTLYGDMNGGFNPIKDIYKMQVYALSHWRNNNVPMNSLGPSGEVIPKNIIEKAPSAELRENQKDEDSLPPYSILDDILCCLVEDELSVNDIVKRGHTIQTVERIENLLYLAEYKRRQSAPGVKISRKIFGLDRRYPITNRFRDKN
ncbi:NAD+ synthase [Bartonella tamiae]|uniref:Glutamine-dependent NAD(+) synthetase n=1 Tax=Bartonella tamiae Th239 TaxID=1094558 RepID=J0QZJ2_9HYPH|nr:NAD+ synthetase [Bartonella tamiae Th239]EJF95091.1 NAD+ synthetase [Bartonella tamiae Th307]